MRNRREVLAAGALAVPTIKGSLAGVELQPAAECKQPARQGPMADYFPNVVVMTHRNEKALFYDDLLFGRIVMINFISTRDKVGDESTANLAKLQEILGDRVGDDIFMFSITTDPEHDTPEVLAEFAERHGVGPGWSLLTGEPANMQALLSRIFVGPHGGSGGEQARPHCSRGLVRYGNLTTGSFGSFPACLRPEYLAQRFDWVGFRRESADA